MSNSNYALALDARIAYETAKALMSASNMQKLAACKNVLNATNVVDLLTTCNVDTAFANRAIASNARMNVYTVEKTVNVLQFVTNASALNAMTRYIFESALSLTDNAMSLTRDDARDACSAHRKVADKSKKAFIKQNVKTVSDSTVAAQHSSSLDALVTLNVFKKTFDNANRDCYVVDKDNAIAKRMIEKLSA